MGFECQHCEKNFSSKYNLQRHIEMKHADQESEMEDSENNTENEESESENEESESENEESESESEDSDSYTYDDVRAILRYALESNDSKE
jgi:hypothetical protein